MLCWIPSKKYDFEAKKTIGKVQTYAFDYIILGVGAEPEFFGIPGIAENSFTLWSFEDAMKIRKHIEEKFYAASLETDPEKRKKLLSFVVAGAGFTGIEMIGELLDYRDVMCRKYFLDPKEVRILNIEALPSILPVLEEPLRAKAEKYLQKRRCEVMLNSAIVGAEPGKVLLKSGEIVETETFIWTCGVKGSSFAGQLGLPTGKRNRIDCDMELKSTKYPFVYVVGDIAGLIFEGKPLAQIVETAHFTAETVAKNIIADIEGGERHHFEPKYHGFMICIGSHYGVSNAGGMKTSGFIALGIKHLINMWYLLNIAGLNQVWEYLRHEFLDMKDRRSFIGDFVSYKVRPYWPLLLRMWLGLMWIFEGINKIGEGWLAFETGSKTSWMFSPGVVQAGVQVAEATSGASAWESAGEAAATSAAGAAAAATSAASAAVAAVPEATSAASAVAAGAYRRSNDDLQGRLGLDQTYPRPKFRSCNLVSPDLHGRYLRLSAVHCAPSHGRVHGDGHRPCPLRRLFHLARSGRKPRHVRHVHTYRHVRMESGVVRVCRNSDARWARSFVRHRLLAHPCHQALVERHTICTQMAFLCRRPDEIKVFDSVEVVVRNSLQRKRLFRRPLRCFFSGAS